MQIQIYYIHIYVDYRWELWKMSAKRKKTKVKMLKRFTKHIINTLKLIIGMKDSNSKSDIKHRMC